MTISSRSQVIGVDLPSLHDGGPEPSCEGVNWYAVYSRSRHEKKIQQQLETSAIECFLPLYEAVHRWKDRRAVVHLPLFPGYLFVHMPVADRMKVLATPGVVRLVSVQGRPVPVPDSEIDVLRNCYAQNAKMQPHPYLTIGRRVLVTSGPFADVEGIFVRKKGQFRLVVSVNLIARSVAVELDRSDIVALCPAAGELPPCKTPVAADLFSDVVPAAPSTPVRGHVRPPSSAA